MASVDTELQVAYEYCRRLTKAEAKNFYYAFITLPAEKRRAIYATYAFCRRCDDATDEQLLTDQKTRLIEQQRQDLEQCFAGLAQDPVYVALRDVTAHYSIPRDHFEQVIDGVEMDLTTRCYQRFEDLRLYCYRVASVVGLISLQIFEYQDLRAREHAIELGLAMQLTNILRDVKEDLERDRIYLPLEDLERFGYSEKQLEQQIVNESFVKLMKFQVARARHYFDRGCQLLGYLPVRSRACPAILSGIYLRILDEIEARNYNVFNDRIGLSSPEKLYIAFKRWTESLLPVPEIISKSW
ncbi:MAG: presqualene diphosphate synthase HpnD [Candidatus Bipolaricaulia bacterium]